MFNIIRRKIKEIIHILRREAGITLIEIMVVVTILAILGGLVIPRLMENVDIAKVKRAKADIRTFSMVLDTYFMQHNSYPTTEEGLKKLVEEGKIKKRKDVLKDPWGNYYEYRSPGENDSKNDYEIWSYGADGKPGGEEYDADIKSWE